jgi:peptidoglycan/LPS O-acetylase OafA/YrhL
MPISPKTRLWLVNYFPAPHLLEFALRVVLAQLLATQLSMAAAALLLLGLSIAAAALLHEPVERPFERRLRGTRPRVSAPAE